MRKFNVIASGDPMINGDIFEKAIKKHLGKYVNEIFVGDWETDYQRLQERRLKVEQQGPEIEDIPDVVLQHGKNSEMLTGLFVPVSSKLMDAMPNLRIVGLSRGGTENINIEEATKRGILAFKVEGRNAEAVSDFTIGLILAESRNIARSHYSIMNGGWQKKFSNDVFIPQLKGKKIGIAGFGYIGRMVAKKLSGWDLDVLVYDAFTIPEEIEKFGYKRVSKEELFRESDFVSINLRLVDATKHWVDRNHLEMMKVTSYFINTARSGLVDMDALFDVLKDKKIAGAALDVFDAEPLEKNNPWITLDNVTLTTHIAGTTTEVLTGSPFLLMEDIERLFNTENPFFILNPEVLFDQRFINWFQGVKK